MAVVAFRNIWLNLVYHGAHLDNPYLFLFMGAAMISSSQIRCQPPRPMILLSSFILIFAQNCLDIEGDFILPSPILSVTYYQ